MPNFTYKAIAKSGQVERGEIAASSASSAQQLLSAKGMTPLQIQLTTAAKAVISPVSSAPFKAQGLSKKLGSQPVVAVGSAPVKPDDVLRFTSELAVLLKAGLPLDRAIKVQIDSAEEGSKKRLLEDLLGALKGGKALSVGLEKRPDVFNSFYISMVRSGEASGNLTGVLQDLGVYLTRAKAVRATVISALIYPAILAVVAVLSIAIMLGYVVPEFQALFEDMGEALPMLTRVVIGLGDFVAAWGWLSAIVLFGLGYLVRGWLKSPAGKLWWDKRVLKLPIAGEVAVKFEVARFARTMGTLIGNGVAVLRATDIAAGTVGNGVLRASLDDLAPTIKRGGRMSEALSPEVFSPVAIQMLRVGEESGSLDTMLLELAQVYEAEVEADVKRGLTLLEPALILGMGGMIAVIIMAILMGILSVNNLAV